MDLFVEQLFVRENTSKEKTMRTIFVIVLGLCAGFSLLGAFTLMLGIYSPLLFPLTVGICYLAFVINGKFNMEFEYALTNGDFDVDIIHNKSKRERIASFECKNIESISIFDNNADYGGKEITIAANLSSERLILIEVMTKKGGKMNIVIEPDDRMYQAIKRCTPRHLTLNLPE